MTEPEEQIPLLSLAAKLYYLDGLGQTEIAEMLGVSRSKVSRLLTRARETGVVTITVNEYTPRNTELEAQLCQRFDMNHAVVVRTFADHSVTSVRQMIGYTAAPLASEWIRPDSIVGMAGGRTLHQLVRFMQPASPMKGITVAQLMSNIGSLVGEIDAIELGRVLAQKFKANFYAVSAPIFAADRATRDALINHPQVRTVWEMFDKMDVAFVGIGTLRNSAFIERGVLNAADGAGLRSVGVAGEICGRFFDAQGQECDTEYRQRVISIELDQLRQIPEVVGVTNGPDRAAAVCAALHGKLLKSLVIDEAGALAVLDEAARSSR